MKDIFRSIQIARALAISTIALAAAATPLGIAQAWTFKTLVTFCDEGKGCKGGQTPDAGLVMDSAGNLYGTTSGPGSPTVFEVERSGGDLKLKTLHNFCSKPNCADGSDPFSPVIIDTAGNLYGTTSQGGATQNGVVFELSPPAGTAKKWHLRLLHEFCGNTCGDGSEPYAGLTYAGASSGAPFDGVSPLYGTTYQGGAANFGTVFELKRGGKGDRWRESVIYSFCSQSGCTDGTGPYAGLLVTSSGTLVGTTQYGGNVDSGSGVVFELAKTGKTWGETVLYTFCSLPDCADGVHPTASLYQDADGNLFGTTRGGDDYVYGNVFKLVPNGAASRLTVLHSYCGEPDCGDGNAPWAALIPNGGGGFYGTTEYGGGNDEDESRNGGGIVFRLTGTHEDIIYRFCATSNGTTRCTDGAYPKGALLRDSAGNLFGTTSEGGGVSGTGTIFELTP